MTWKAASRTSDLIKILAFINKMLKSLKKFKLGSGVSYRGIKRYPNKNTRTEFNLERKKMQREMT